MRSSRAFKFGRHDRLVIDGAHYRAVKRHAGRHVLQLVVGYTIEDHYVDVSDTEITGLMAGPNVRMRVDREYWSSSLAMMRLRHDNSNVKGLGKAALQTVEWKLQWVRRFMLRRVDLTREQVKLTEEGLTQFIAEERDSMDRWFLDTFGERRRPGRIYKDRDRKDFDYPSWSTLYKWLAIWHAEHERDDAFNPKYKNCGNRDQLHPLVSDAVKKALDYYRTPLKLKIKDLQKFIERELEAVNRDRRDNPLKVSDKALRRRIGELDPFLVMAGRDGLDRALRAFALSGVGLPVTRPLERIEMDDWEFDLHALVVKSKAWRAMDPAKRKAVPRVRCTLTVAIDVATRAVVGLNVTTGSPSGATSKTVLRSTCVDQTPLAKYLGCLSDWPMFGRGEYFATDGGPAFREEFQMAVRRSRAGHTVPDQDPRMRGTVESFFRRFKVFCRNFSGQAFANVVERGDYQAEKAASLTVEELYALLIRYVVDVYHHAEHRGLEGSSPYATWRRLAADGLEPPHSDMELKVAFGYRVNRTMSREGIRLFDLRYLVSDKNAYGELLKIVGNAKVEIVVDPFDMTSILLKLPKRAIGDPRMPDGDFMVLRTVDDVAKDQTLGDILAAREDVREFVEAERKEGREIRLKGEAELFEKGLEAMRRANIPVYGFTQGQLDAMLNLKDRKSLAATGKVKHSATPTTVESESYGEIVASETKAPDKGTRKKPRSRSYGGSINTYGEDE